MMSGFLPLFPRVAANWLRVHEQQKLTMTHTHSHTKKKRSTDLPEGALTQDLAQLKLLGVGLLRALFNVMRDADLLHRHVILRSNTQQKRIKPCLDHKQFVLSTFWCHQRAPRTPPTPELLINPFQTSDRSYSSFQRVKSFDSTRLEESNHSAPKQLIIACSFQLCDVISVRLRLLPLLSRL